VFNGHALSLLESVARPETTEGRVQPISGTSVANATKPGG
jgi:hypothetical protein